MEHSDGGFHLCMATGTRVGNGFGCVRARRRFEGLGAPAMNIGILSVDSVLRAFMSEYRPLLSRVILVHAPCSQGLSYRMKSDRFPTLVYNSCAR